MSGAIRHLNLSHWRIMPWGHAIVNHGHFPQYCEQFSPYAARSRVISKYRRGATDRFFGVRIGSGLFEMLPSLGNNWVSEFQSRLTIRRRCRALRSVSYCVSADRENRELQRLQYRTAVEYECERHAFAWLAMLPERYCRKIHEGLWFLLRELLSERRILKYI